jgi:hypothetical protein
VSVLGVGDTVQAISDANYNCCAGDVISIVDLDSGLSHEYEVPANGANSSCIQP